MFAAIAGALRLGHLDARDGEVRDLSAVLHRRHLRRREDLLQLVPRRMCGCASLQPGRAVGIAMRRGGGGNS
jgi:hypothetical protein